MQVAAGCKGITVAKSGEMEVMAEAGLDSILIAYPLFGQEKWRRVARLARDRSILVAVDSCTPAEGLSEAARLVGSRVGILVEFDVGMRRCGVATPEDVLRITQSVSRLPGLEFRGVLFYPGHIWDPPERQAPALAAVGEKVQAVIGLLARNGFPCEIVSGGGTPTGGNCHLVPGTTETRAGTYVFNDRNTIGVGACREEDCALRVIVTVVSNAVPGRAIVDGGSKTFSSDRWLSGSEGFGLMTGHSDVVISAMSEEHGIFETANTGFQPRVGERVSIIPNHVCACVNLHDEIHFHRKGVVDGSWRVSGRGKVR
jgi:D-serine deaminase-like pyridoxal phosphate-dependent protein